MAEATRYEKRIGAIIDGKWRLDRLLGWGATSAVYEATHRNGVRAALKILHPELCTDRAVRDRFLREAAIANRVKHPAISTVRDDGITDDGSAFLVLELLEGETLEALRVRRGGRISLAELAPVADELMDVLEAVHAAGVVHRDLEPRNVLITGLASPGPAANDAPLPARASRPPLLSRPERSGARSAPRVKLLDFGMARLLGGSLAPPSMRGILAAAPCSYAAPELARGSSDEVDAQSDVWSLGALLFAVLSGAPPASGATPPSLASVAPALPAAVVEVVDRALAPSKDQRWANIASMRAAFRRAAEKAIAEETVSSTEPVEESAPRHDESRPVARAREKEDEKERKDRDQAAAPESSASAVAGAASSEGRVRPPDTVTSFATDAGPSTGRTRTPASSAQPWPVKVRVVAAASALAVVAGLTFVGRLALTPDDPPPRSAAAPVLTAQPTVAAATIVAEPSSAAAPASAVRQEQIPKPVEPTPNTPPPAPASSPEPHKQPPSPESGAAAAPPRDPAPPSSARPSRRAPVSRARVVDEPSPSSAGPVAASPPSAEAPAPSAPAEPAEAPASPAPASTTPAAPIPPQPTWGGGGGQAADPAPAPTSEPAASLPDG